MNFITTSYNRILEQIQSLGEKIETIQKFIDSVSTIVINTYNFLDPIFSFLPWEVFVLLILTLILLSWINGLFPSTPKWNYTLIVCVLCLVWGYSESSAFPEVGAPWGRILLAGLYLLLPVHLLGLLSLIARKGYNYYLFRKKINPKDLDEFLVTFERESRRIVSSGHSIIIGDMDESVLLKQVDELSVILETIKKKGIKKPSGFSL